MSLLRSLILATIIFQFSTAHADVLQLCKAILEENALDSEVGQLVEKMKAIKKIKISDVKNLEVLAQPGIRNGFEGEGFYALYAGTYNGKKVFAKTIGTEREAYKEILKWKVFEEIGLANLHAYAVVNGRTTVVVNFVDGVAFDNYTPIPRGYKVTQETLEDLNAIQDALNRSGFNQGFDLQLMITPKGRLFPIDPEFIRFPGENPKPDERMTQSSVHKDLLMYREIITARLGVAQ